MGEPWEQQTSSGPSYQKMLHYTTDLAISEESFCATPMNVWTNMTTI